MKGTETSPSFTQSRYRTRFKSVSKSFSSLSNRKERHSERNVPCTVLFIAWHCDCLNWSRIRALWLWSTGSHSWTPSQMPDMRHDSYRCGLLCGPRSFDQCVLVSGPLLGSMTTFLYIFFSWSHNFLDSKARRPLWQEDGSLVCITVNIKSGSLRIHDHTLLSHPWLVQIYPWALGSISVASYDSQGYGGGILTRLHTGL
jgi:hypothetical protein